MLGNREQVPREHRVLVRSAGNETGKVGQGKSQTVLNTMPNIGTLL